ncbi:ATP-binding protein [Candidatus Pacearchaeota archaeon]|nr:MAG: ATP-binding protein [Candidatus Pacearchaeota archaeon]
MEYLFFKHNPWWEYKNWESKDKNIRDFNSMDIKWIPSWIDEISLKPFSLNFIIGPRQVGKTTGIKLLIKNLLKKVNNPYSIFYFNCDFLSDIKDLINLIENYLKIKESEKIKTSFIFLDEITSLEYWWKPIKGFIDVGIFDKDILVISGSSSIRTKKYSESFPGRRGRGKNISVLPLSFFEYLKVHNIDIKKSNEFQIRGLFKKYLSTGGFPKSINKVEFEEELVKSIEREIFNVGKDVELFRKIILKIIEKLPSSFSYNIISSNLGISHNTVRDYMQTMEDLFILKIIYWKYGKEIEFRKDKKICFRDPYLVKAFCNVYGCSLREDFLYENIVQEHLFRKFGEIYYFKNRFEIDCIAKNLKIEVKAGKPHRKYPKGVLILDKERIPRFLVDIYSEKQNSK